METYVALKQDFIDGLSRKERNYLLLGSDEKLSITIGIGNLMLSPEGVGYYVAGDLRRFRADRLDVLTSAAINEGRLNGLPAISSNRIQTHSDLVSVLESEPSVLVRYDDWFMRFAAIAKLKEEATVQASTVLGWLSNGTGSLPGLGLMGTGNETFILLRATVEESSTFPVQFNRGDTVNFNLLLRDTDKLARRLWGQDYFPTDLQKGVVELQGQTDRIMILDDLTGWTQVEV